MLQQNLPQTESAWTHKQRRITEKLIRFKNDLRKVNPDLPLLIRRMVHTIHERLFESDLTVTSLRERCQVSNNNASTQLRQATGFTPREYIELLRLQAATDLIKTGNIEIYLVAMAVGYHNPETFFRAFRRRFGCSPTMHRRPTSEE